MALFTSWLYVRVSWFYFLPGYMWECHGFIFFLVICEGVMALFSSWLYVSVSWLYFLPGYMWGCHGFIFFLVICESVMALFSSWLHVRVSWLYFLPRYMWGCHGFIFFLVICQGVMALFSSWLYVSVMALCSSWLYVRVSWLFLFPGYMWGCHGFIYFLVICECWYFTLTLTEAWMHRCTKWNIKPVPIFIEVTVLSQESNRSPLCVLRVPISLFIRFDVLCWNCSDSVGIFALHFIFLDGKIENIIIIIWYTIGT
jgi:hypothetical protein